MCSVSVYVCLCVRARAPARTWVSPVYVCKNHIWEEARRAARSSGVVVVGVCEPPNMRTRL